MSLAPEGVEPIDRRSSLTRVCSIVVQVWGTEMLKRSLAAALSGALILGTVVFADDKKPADKAAEVQKKEAFVQSAIAVELGKLATYCQGKNAFDEAKNQCDLGLQIAADNKALKEQLATIASAADKNKGKPVAKEFQHPKEFPARQ